jgi:hypothetical protein
MELLEVVVQGLRGFPQMTRVACGQGVTVIHPIGGSEQILTAAVLSLLYPPETGGPDPLPGLVDPQAEVARVGILVRARDGTAYRVLRDLKAQKWSLLREAKGGFSPVTSRPADIAQATTATLGFPQQDIFRDVFVTRYVDLPSQTPEEAAPPPLPPDASGPMAMPGMMGMRPASEFAGVSDEELQERLGRINKALTHNAAIREIEQSLDAVQSELYTLDDELGHIDTLRKSVKDAEKQLEEFKYLEGMPTDIIARVERHKRAEGVLKKDLSRLEQERIRAQKDLSADLAEAQSPMAVVNAAFHDKMVAGGTAAGFLALIVGVMGAISFEPLRYVALLDIVAFGVALVGAWRFIGEAEHGARMKYRLERLKEEEHKKKSDHALEDEAISDIFARFDMAKEDYLRVEHSLNKRAEAQGQLESARGQLNQVLSDPSVNQKSKRRDELRAQVTQGEEKLYATGGYMGDVNDLRAQKEEIEAILRGEKDRDAGAAAPTDPAMAMQLQMMQQMQQMQQQMGAGGARVPDPTPKLTSHASDMLMSGIDETCEMLKERVGQYLGGLTDRRFGQVMFGPQGQLTLVETASGRGVPFVQLPPGDRDIAYLSLKLTICEAVVRRGRLPILLERALETVPPPKDPMNVRMLQYLGGLTQVVVMTRRQSLVPSGQQVSLQ